MKKKPNNHFQGDTVDREAVRDVLIKMRKLEPDYSKKESVNEELQNSQGEQTDFKKGDLVKDINPDCPHHGSEGKVTKVGKGTITFDVTNSGRTYKEGDELEKTVDQMVKLKESVNESGILYKAGVKKYGKEGMAKILSAAGKRKSHAEIGAIKDKYEKESLELDEAGMGILTTDQADVLQAIVCLLYTSPSPRD